jgi:hypothetical protein
MEEFSRQQVVYGGQLTVRRNLINLYMRDCFVQSKASKDSEQMALPTGVDFDDPAGKKHQYEAIV